MKSKLLPDYHLCNQLCYASVSRQPCYSSLRLRSDAVNGEFYIYTAMFRGVPRSDL